MMLLIRVTLPLWLILDAKVLEIGKEADKQALIGLKSAGSFCRAYVCSLRSTERCCSDFKEA